ncbi:MAG: hypothetical protein OEZ32_00570 [Nitrospinota bacterium]|nr:hypothetical protein [Nitrospinota bacterium]
MSFLVRLSLGWGVGVGCFSILLFFLMISPINPRFLPWIEVAAAGCLVAAYFLSIRGRGGYDEDFSAPSRRQGWIALMAGVVFIIVMAAAAYVFAAKVAITPEGEWDAWMTWNLRAKAFYYFQDNWDKPINYIYGWTHLDYPLLLPLSVTRLWMLSQSASHSIEPIIIAFLFTFSLPLMVFSFICSLRGAALGLAAGGALLSAETVYLLGGWLYADLPLTFYITASVGLAAMATEKPERAGRTWALAGLCAGLAAWTKNEGMLFLVVIIGAVGAVTLARSGWRQAARRLGMIGVGIAAPTITLIAFKLAIPSQNFLIRSNSLERILDSLTDPERYASIVIGVTYEIFHYGGFVVAGNHFSAPVLALIFLAAWGPRKGSMRLEAIQISLVCLAAMLAGYSTVYLLSPLDINFQILTTVSRLLTHVWPLFLLCVMLAASRDQENESTAPVPAEESAKNRDP